jgi:ankyrin repeat protein
VKTLLKKNKDLAYQINGEHLYEYFYHREYKKLSQLLDLLPDEVQGNLLKSNHIVFLFLAVDTKDVTELYQFLQTYDFDYCRNFTYGDFRIYSVLDVYVLNNCLDEGCSPLHKKVFDFLYKVTSHCYREEYFLNILFYNLLLIKKRELNMEFLENVITKDMIKDLEINVLHPLYNAIQFNHLELLKLLIKKGCDINMESVFNNSLLNYALMMSASEEIIKYLLDQGVDTHKTSTMYELPFQSMFMNYQHKLYSYPLQNRLLEKTDINHQDILGNTPLHYIVMDDDWKNYREVLSKKEINIYLKNKDGKSVYDFLKDDKEFMKLKFIKEDDREDITFPKSNYASYNLSNSGLFDIVNLLYLLIKKNSNIAIPYVDEVLDPIIDSLNATETLISNNSYLPLQIYRNVNGLVKISPMLEKAILMSTRDYVFVLVYIDTTTVGHANCVIIDKPLKRIVHFEPNGGNTSMDNQNMKLMYKQIEKYFKKVLPGYKFVNPSEYLPRNGFQVLSQEHTTFDKRINDLAGYCLYWCLWFCELYVHNNHKNLSELIDKTIKKMTQKEYRFKEFIRNYANHMFNLRVKMFQDMGMNDRIIYSQWFPSDTIGEVCLELKKRVKQELGL